MDVHRSRSGHSHPADRPADHPALERWLPVVGYEGHYEVSDHGRVRSLKWGKTRILKQPTIRGRSMVCLSLNNETKARNVHRLVLEAFVGPRPEGMESCHWDDDATNNHLSNLRYDTHAGNYEDFIRNGKHPYAGKTHCRRGHEFTEENTRRRPSRPDARECLTCVKERLAAKTVAV